MLRGCVVFDPRCFVRSRFHLPLPLSSTRLAGVVLVSVLMLTQCVGVPGPASGQPPPIVDPAVRAALGTEPVRIILELRIAPAFRPEGDLPSPAAVEAQRRAIARARDELLAKLAGTSFTLTNQYDALPFLGLLIGADALSRLEVAGDVVARIAPDRQVFPQR